MIDKNRIKDLAYQFLLAIGEDPQREGLIDTPKRVAEMCEEMFTADHAKAKYVTFQANNYDGIVMVKDIEFSSVCEHHLLPFIGKAHIAYIPNRELIGISKLARILDKHSRRLQLQENLISAVANEIQEQTDAKGVAVYMEAKHLCMNIRGISRMDAATVTTVFIGEFKASRLQEMFMNLSCHTVSRL